MSEAVNEKEAQFERLWAGETPKGVNRTKALKFRQYMKQHVLQKYHKRRKEQFASADKGHYNHSFTSKHMFLTKENCREILDGGVATRNQGLGELLRPRHGKIWFS